LQICMMQPQTQHSNFFIKRRNMPNNAVTPYWSVIMELVTFTYQARTRWLAQWLVSQPAPAWPGPCHVGCCHTDLSLYKTPAETEDGTRQNHHPPVHHSHQSPTRCWEEMATPSALWSLRLMRTTQVYFYHLHLSLLTELQQYVLLLKSNL
jgi:hypothetical protein